MNPGREPLPVGKQLDALVADKVFGLVPCTHPNCPGKPWCYAKPQSQDKGSEVPMYSEDIAAAWQVVEKLDLLKDYSLHHGAGKWVLGSTTQYEGFDRVAEADTAPHAICLAALKRVNSAEWQTRLSEAKRP